MDARLSRLRHRKASDKPSSSMDFVRDMAGDEAIVFDGLDEAVIGVGNQHGKPPVVVYDADRMAQALARDLDGDIDGAWEWLEFNVLGLYAGDRTPIIVFGIPGEAKHA